MVEYQLPKLNTRVRFPSLAPNYFKRNILVAGCVLSLLSGCATVEDHSHIIDRVAKKGVYHKVQEGETIWRIANTYQVKIFDIIESNNIPNVAHIEENQLIFIPGVEQIYDIASVAADANVDDGGFSWPLRGKVSPYYGERKGREISKGIGIMAQPGEKVKAARTGDVVFADQLAGYDYMIILDHLDGYFSVYAKNSKLLVKLGQRVNKGDPVAVIAESGRSNCLYLEIRKNGKTDNPLFYLPKL